MKGVVMKGTEVDRSEPKWTGFVSMKLGTIMGVMLFSNYGFLLFTRV